MVIFRVGRVRRRKREREKQRERVCVFCARPPRRHSPRSDASVARWQVERAMSACRKELLAPSCVSYVLPSGAALAARHFPTAYSSTASASSSSSSSSKFERAHVGCAHMRGPFEETPEVGGNVVQRGGACGLFKAEEWGVASTHFYCDVCAASLESAACPGVT